MRTKLAGVSAAGVGAATAVAALLLGTTSGNAQETANSAYGLYLGLAGEDVVDREPSVSWTSGDAVTGELVDVNEDALRIQALTVAAGPEGSESKVAGLGLLEGEELLPIEGAPATDGLLSLDVLTTTCTDGVGTVEIVNGSLLGEELPGEPEINETVEAGLDLAPLLTLTVNRQTENQDGSLTVDGLVLEVLPPSLDEGRMVDPAQMLPLLDGLLAPEGRQLNSEGLPTEELPLGDLLDQLRELNPDLGLGGDGEPLVELVLASATCGPIGDDETSAPKPEPIETHLPVTH